MTVRELYDRIGGDYSDVINRLRIDTLVKRFALMFLNDPNFAELKDSLEKGDIETAFRNAHTLKGVAANLSFAKLHESASEMTEYLRNGKLDKAKEYYGTIEADYNVIIKALVELKNAQ